MNTLYSQGITTNYFNSYANMNCSKISFLKGSGILFKLQLLIHQKLKKHFQVISFEPRRANLICD